MSCRDTIWRRPPALYALLQNETHVWRASVDQPPDFYTCLLNTLSPEERARADRFHFEADRKRCILARGLLRLLLGHCLGRRADQMQFQYGGFGKPSLIGGPLRSMQFNVSHSGDLILIAISRSSALGVDIERMRADVATDEIAARFFSANECRDLALVAPEMRCEAFFSCWTRKEAYLKARGDGLSLPLEQFDVSFLPGDQPRLIETRHDPTEASRWTLHALDGGPGYKAALAVEGKEWKLQCWDLPTASVDSLSGDLSGEATLQAVLACSDAYPRR